MDRLGDKLKEHFQRLINEKQITGARYCIYKGHSLAAKGELGMTDPYVDIQSITKWFTAAAILQLQEKGKIFLDDPVAKYIPDLAEPPFSTIRVRHLLTHTSGLAALQDAFPERDLDWEAGLSAENAGTIWIQEILRKGMFFTPGTRWEYSKAGFCILGEIISRITGQRAEEYMQKNILIPCGMEKSHWKGGDAVQCVIPQTAAGLFTPIGELAQFGQMLANGGIYNGRTLLGEESLKAMETNQLRDDMRDFCWDHGGKRVAYGAGCPVCVSGYEPQWKVGDGTMYHEGAGASMLFVNREQGLAGAWSTPFCNKENWQEEAVKGTAAVVWECLCSPCGRD